MHILLRKYNQKYVVKSPVYGVDFLPGDTLQIKMRQYGDDNNRIITLTGLCIAKKNAGMASSCIVRIMSQNVGVERRISIYSPLVQSIKVIRAGVSRRAKMFYIRKLSGKKARIKQDYSARGIQRVAS